MRQTLSRGGGRRCRRVARRTDGRLRDTFGEGVFLVAAGTATATATQRGMGGAVVRARRQTLCAESWRGRARGGLRVRGNLVTCRWLWSTRRRPFLALGASRASRAGRASSTRGSVCTCRSISCLSDAVPWVTSNNCGRNRTAFVSLFLCYLAIFIIVVVLEWVGGHRRRAGSGAVPFERGQRACIGRGCQSGRGRGRGFLLLGF